MEGCWGIRKFLDEMGWLLRRVSKRVMSCYEALKRQRSRRLNFRSIVFSAKPRQLSAWSSRHTPTAAQRYVMNFSTISQKHNLLYNYVASSLAPFAWCETGCEKCTYVRQASLRLELSMYVRWIGTSGVQRKGTCDGVNL